MSDPGQPPAPVGDITEDAFLGGQLRLRQPKRGHRAGHDAILLSAATPAQAGQRVVEFGSGVGAAGLAVARRVGGVELVLVEIDRMLADLAQANAALNAIAAEVVALDVTAGPDEFYIAGLQPDSADIVLMNPPFNRGSRFQSSPDRARQAAHVASDDMLDKWVHAARRVLKSGGVLTLIWRADGLADVLGALTRGFGSLVVIPIHPDSVSPAIRILVRATKGGRAPMELFPGLALNKEAGIPTPEAQAILSGQMTLPPAKPSAS